MAMASTSITINTTTSGTTTSGSSTTTATCLPRPPMKAVSNGLLQGDIPLDFALPLLIVQIVVVLLVTRTLACMFRRIRQPRVLAEIIGGVLLGPTALGRNAAFRDAVFPARSLPLLETVATMGLMFFIFIVGLQLDLSALRRSGKSALLIAISGIAAPFAASSALAPLVLHSSAAAAAPPRLVPLLVFMGTPLSISAFSVLVRVMAELGMLSTDVAKLAVPSAAVNDVSVWTLLAVGVAIAGPNSNPLVPLWVLLCGMALGLAMLAFGRGFMGAVARRAVRQSGATDLYVCITLTAVLVAGFASDAIGVHPLLGPFLLGMFMPKDNDFPAMIVDKTEDFVTGLMLPLFFASSGLKTNLSSLRGVASVGFLALFFAAAAFGKIAATFVAARLCGLPTRRALVLGFLMNTKGLAVLIVLNVGRDLHALTDELFAILVLTCLLTSFLTFPIVSALWGTKGDVLDTGNDSVLPGGGGGDAEQSSSTASSTAHSHSLQAVENNARRQLRLLVALGGGSDRRHYDYAAAAALVDVVEAARGGCKKKGSQPLKLYTLWLEQLSDRRSGILRLLYGTNLAAKTYFGRGGGSTAAAAVDGWQQKCWKRAERSAPRTQAAAVFVPSFQPSDSLSKVQVRPMTAVSELDEEHRAIAAAAARKQAALIILPWLFKKEGFHGSGDDGEAQHLPRSYLHLLDHQQSPCSVAILVVAAADGGSTATVRPSCCASSYLPYKVVLLFCGGADDREALSLACRMAEHPSVRLRVIRLIVTGTTKLPDVPSQQEDDDDQEAIARLKQKATEKERSGAAAAVHYEEEEVVGVEAAVKRMAAAVMREANLVMVGHRSRADGGGAGRRRRRLGLIGDILVSTSGGGGGEDDSAAASSILVVHQHDSAAASTPRKI